ncbi:MAG TPA: tetratricopeptide repeat protein [Bryobacteraceae bacterium]|nr:tetratricopeptide repeat protein [Bryobacteraceae bacterium]
MCLCATLALQSCRKSAAQYIERGNQLYAAGKYNDATLNYRNALQKEPNSGEAYYRLGLVLMKQSQLGEAYQSFNHAVSLDPKNIQAKIQLGQLSLAAYSRDPKHPPILYNQAKRMADQLAAPGGNRVESLRLKAGLAVVDNQPGAAVDLLKTAQQLAPNNVDVQGQLAQTLARDNQPDEAEKTALQTIAKHPQFAASYELLYLLYTSRQSWDKAESVLKQWSANNPKDSSPVLRLAAFYYGRKQPQDAEKTLDSILNARDRFPQADLLVGDFHAITRNMDKALADYQRGESRDQTRKETYQEREASALATLGRFPDAIKTADAILAKNPKNQLARSLKVEVLERLGGADNFKTAAAIANDLAKDAPANARIQRLASEAALRNGDVTDASTYLQRAAQDDPRSPAAQIALARLELMKKNYPGVLEHANSALAIRPTDNGARLYRVIGLTGTHAYAAAKTEAEQLAKDTKDAPQVQMQLGVIALGQGHYAEAEELFRKLYKDGKDDATDLQPLAGLVNTLEAEHMPDKALALMQQEAERSPNSNGKQALLVATAEAAGKNDVALNQLQKMAEQNPKSAQIQARLGQLEQKDGHLQEALRAYEKARQLAPNQKGLDALVANLQEQLGDNPQAIANYRKALAKTPDDPVVLNNLAFLLAQTGGDNKEALQMVSTALRKAPNVPQLRDTLAWVEIKSNNTSEALPILHTLTDKYPENTTFRYHYAVALMQSGDRAGAKRQAEMALSKNPPFDLTNQLHVVLSQAQ